LVEISISKQEGKTELIQTNASQLPKRVLRLFTDSKHQRLMGKKKERVSE